jgi:hypothetical protein
MSGLERLGRKLAEEQDALVARSESRALVRERIAQHEPRPVRRGVRPWHAAIAGGLVAAASVLALLLRPSAPQPLTLRVGSSGQRVLPGAWLEAPAGSRALALAFSDGTRVELEPRTRARVVTIDGHGAHLLIESGLAHVGVVPRPGTAYRLSVGPFAVRVIGTRFDVRWNPEQDAFRIDLTEGHVELSGCVFGRGYALDPGRAVDASCKRGRFHLEQARPQLAAVAAAPAMATPSLPEASAITRDVPAQPRTQRALAGWRTLARKGEYAAAFAAARDAGFENECERADADDLAMLAEIARYAGQRTHESAALLLMRRRFEGTPRAALAAFALGRLEFDGRHAHAKAAQWFGTYLKEQPDGALSREAHGRLIEATLAAGDRAGARVLALDYRRKHPNGPHTKLAQELLDAPLAGGAMAPARPPR